MKAAWPLFAFFIISALGMPAAETGTVEGRVALPPAPPPVVVPQRYEVVTQDGVVATNPPLAVVYLEGEFKSTSAPATVRLVQKDLAFIPSLLAVEVGTRVEFANEDDTFHNVFSFSPAKRFDLGRYRPTDKPVPSQVFETPGLVTLRCEIHKHMRGLVLVLATPHFVVSAPDGHYVLEGLPPGKYVLKAWVDSKTTRSQPVEIFAGEKVRADFP